jgi:NAD(P)H-flavin reductase
MRSATDTPPVPIAPDPWRPVPHVVRHVIAETHDVVTLAIEPVGPPLARAEPGQFSMLYAFGVGEVPISVSRIAPDGPAVWHTVKAVGATTRALAGHGREHVIGVRGPYGRGWDVDGARGHDIVVMGGGIGFAPLRPVVDHVVRHRDDFARVAVVVGARTPDDILFAADLAAWRAHDIAVHVTVDRASGDWTGDIGVVTQLLPRVAFDPARTTAFVCGPEVMMRFAARALLDRAVPASAIRVSLERNMVCGTALCGHCQLGGVVVCRDGPVLTWDAVGRELAVRER